MDLIPFACRAGTSGTRRGEPADTCALRKATSRKARLLGGLIASLTACAALVVSAAPATAATSPRAFQAVGTPELTGTASDGTVVACRVHVVSAELSPISPPGSGVTAPTGNLLLVIDFQTDVSVGTNPNVRVVNSVPTEDVSLRMASGLVPATYSGTPTGGLLSGSYFFAVPASTTSAQVDVAPFTTAAFEDSGAPGPKLTQVSFGPSTIHLTAARSPNGRASKPGPVRGAHSAGGLSFPTEFGLGVAGGGVAVFVVVVPVVVRRRRYERADREGRVVVEAPPVPAPPPRAERRDFSTPSAAPDSADAVAGPVRVGVLGPVVVEGLRKVLTMSPVREILVFLAVHPGRAFTSIGLRDTIWTEGRDRQPKATTFRNYLVDLRKALPEGVLVSAGSTSRLSDAVISDWSVFESLAGRSGASNAELIQALGLVRGRPFEGAFEGRNSPYAWAAELVLRIEASVEAASHELAHRCVESDDLEGADWALDRGLSAVPTSVVLHEDRLRVGAAVGGEREVSRRLAAATVALGGDVRALAAIAHELGLPRR